MKHIFFLASIAFVSGLFCMPLQAQVKPEPKYEGKPLNYWVERLQKCEKDEDRNAAAKAIKAFGQEAAPAVPALVEMLDDRSDSFRDLVGEILAVIGPGAKSAVPALITLSRRKRLGVPRLLLKSWGRLARMPKKLCPFSSRL